MAWLVVDLSISADQFLRLYQGSADTVIAQARDGRKVRFPAGILRPYVSPSGVSGSFRLEYDQQNRLKKLEKIR